MNKAITLPDDELPWKARVEEPANRYLYYPLARQLVRLLVKTPITANQVTLIQPLIAAVASYLITFEDWRYLVAGAITFELRSLLDCADGTLARAKNTSSASGHALDGLADWLAVVFLYSGIYIHFRLHPPPAGEWSSYVPMGAVLLVSALQGALRSFAADYYMRKFGSILASGRDETVEDLRDKQRVLTPDSPFWAKVEAWIGRCGHLSFQREYFDVERSKSISGQQAAALIEQRNGPMMKFMARLWSVSSGDAFIRLSVLSLFFGHYWMWQLQLFWATFGVLWVNVVVGLNGWFVKRAAEALPQEIQTV